MNLQPLYELKDRLSACAVAGVGLLPEDFRLARAVQGMKPLAGASPVFQRIAALSERLLSCAAGERAGLLLDDVALVDAVLCTQGATRADGELIKLGLSAGGDYQPLRYSALAPVLGALSRTGGGRYEIVIDTIDRRPALIRDYRLREALVGGLGDSYSEIADRIESFLAREDESLAPVLKKGFDPMGKRDMVRRVRVMASVAGGGENGWYLSMLEQKCSAEVQCALLHCLRFRQENAQWLLNFVKKSKGSAQKAALASLAYLNRPEVDEYFIAQLHEKPKSVGEFLAASRSEQISELAAQRLLELLERALEVGKLTQAELESFGLWLRMARNKTSRRMLEFYRKASGACGSIAAVKRAEQGGGAAGIKLLECAGSYEPLAEAIGSVMKDTAERTGNGDFFSLALALWQEDPNRINAGAAALAGLLSLSPAKAYDLLGAKAAATRKLSRDRWLEEGWGAFWRVMGGLRRVDGQCSIVLADALAVDRTAFRPLGRRLDSRWYALMCDPQVARPPQNSAYSYALLAGELADQDDKEACAGIIEALKSYMKKRPGRSLFDHLERLGERDFGGLIAPYAASGNYIGKGELLKLFDRSSMSPEAMAAELEEIVATCRKRRVERLGYDLTVDHVKEIARQIKSGVPLQKVVL